jgi:hyperosmotically inducible protein
MVPAVALCQSSDKAHARLVKEVGHELRMLPYYSVFDNFGYKVDGNNVTLVGQVTRPTLKSDAERVVKSIEGVETVNNQIEVLPLSPNDDRLRIAVYNALASKPGIDRYFRQAMPSIHIIVKNGTVTLEGIVDSQGDKDRVNIYANGVPGVFKVINNLQVVKP